ncbi:MAG: nucleotidyl transferase AbiEii/AbiGii toxin family protein [Nanoarchaeota archaeon]
MKELIDYLSGRLNNANKQLLEKDIILHRILLRLMQTQFRREFAFKGGTCLTKCYFGYFRFSEDIDFTYINQEEFKGKSQKEVRRLLSSKIDSILELLEKMAKELNLDFNKEKAHKRYVELGGSNKFATFKLWYESDILKKEQFVKVQINFVELFTSRIIENTAKSLYAAIPEKEMRLLYPGYEDIIQEVKVRSYSLTEILFEKIRAILTRRSIKARDFIDVYLIQRRVKADLAREEIKILKKIRFMLQYDKYLQNLSAMKLEEVVLGDEEKLLLEPLDEGLREFLPEFSKYLKALEKKLQKQK